MSADLWPAMMPFDPEADPVPSALGGLLTPPAGALPAVLMVAGAEADRQGWGARAAVRIATAWADRGAQIILADVGLESPQLHEVLGEANTDGVADIFQFGASLRWMARVVPGHGFRFLPVGAYVPDGAAVLRDPRWESLIAQCAADQATLLAYAPEGTAGLDALASRIGRVVVLAETAEADAVVERFSALAAVELVLSPPVVPAPAAVAGPASTPPESYEDEAEVDGELLEPPPLPWKGSPRRKGSPLLWLSLVAACIVGGWVAFGDRIAPSAPAEAPPVAQEQDGPPPPAPAPVESPLPYSVAVEAHLDYATALERVAALRGAEKGSTFFLAPIPYDSLVYYRVMAGAVADTTAAWGLMRRLVAAGHMTELTPWAVRPTVWAYHLGDFESRDAALARGEELLKARVPTYVVEIDYTAGPPRHRLYAGAYDGPALAEIMAQLLKEAGVSAPLVRRHGKAAS
jgi:hypothetical protein